MNSKRTLRLRREVLAALATEELAAVVGAATGPSDYLAYCVTDPVNSGLLPCPTPPYTAHC